MEGNNIIIDEVRAFNSYYVTYGWIAHESLNYQIMCDALSLAKNGKAKEGNEHLIKYFSNNIEKLYYILKHSSFKKRWDILQEAKALYKENRYISCIPLQLILIDGVTNDVAGFGFASDKIDMSVWGSIIGDEQSFKDLKTYYNSNRTKTNIKQITFPYRNGILHGQDANYGNKEVSVKCWNILFALADWIKAKKLEQKKKEKFEKDSAKSFEDIKNEILEINTIKEEISEFKSRKIEINKLNKDCKNFEKSLPEYAIYLFFDYLKQKNYGYAYSLLSYKYKKNHTILELKKSVINMNFDDCFILSVDHYAIAIANIKIKVNDKVSEIILNFEDDESKTTTPNKHTGHWVLYNSKGFDFLWL